MSEGDTGRRRFRLRRTDGEPSGGAIAGRIWASRWTKAALALVLLALAGYATIMLVFARDLPSVETLRQYQPPLPTTVRAIDGAPVQSFARERRVVLRFDEYPKLLVNAYLAAEDRTFFSHGGVDYPGIVAALITNFRSDDRPIGASTITQQVAKNLLLSNEVTYTRKLREAILAYRIEDALTKEQILELYLNQIFLGRNAYGVQAASRAYFDKDVDDLTLPEAAYLAILPKAPSTYDPVRRNERATARRNYVIDEMARSDFITAAQAAQAKATPLTAAPNRGSAIQNAGGYYMEEVRRQLIERFGDDDEAGPNSVYAGGLWVRTSYDPRLQALAQTALRDGLMRYDRGKGWHGPIERIEPGEGWAGRLAAANIGVGYDDWRAAVIVDKGGGSATIGFTDGATATMAASDAAIARRAGGTAFSALEPGDIVPVKLEGGDWVLRNIPEVSGGMVVQDPRNGRILAMQGGFDSRLRSFNNATQALRQPGSTIKPFVYAAALDQGMTPASIIVDGPVCVFQSASLGTHCFRNFGGQRGAGPQTMRWGLEQSRNLMTMRAAIQTGMPNVTRTISRMGIGDYPAYPAVALGAGETTVLKLTNAYSTMVNLGRELKPTLIDYVQDRNGKAIFRADTRPCEGCNARDYSGAPMPRPPVSGRQVMDAMTAYQMVHMLEGVIDRGTAQRLRDIERPLFGKTGTTNGPREAWFVGGSADMVAGLYVGFDQPRDLGGYVQGGNTPAPIFRQFAQGAFEGMPIVPFRAPEGVRMVRIDRRSGRRVYGTWPTDDPRSAVIWEAFKPESEPRRTIRREEIAERTAAEAAGRTRRGARRDSEFLERQGGIY